MKMILMTLTILATTSVFAAGISSKCDSGVTSEMVECMGQKSEIAKAKIRTKLEKMKLAVQETISEEELTEGTLEYAESVISDLNSVVKALDVTISKVCAAEAASETVMGSISKIIYGSCRQAKLESFEKAL